MGDRAEDKRERLVGALDRGMAMIHLDARRPGVRVPEHLRNESHLRLNLSYRFDPPDLALTAVGASSTLSFGGRRYHCVVPWTAIFAITSHATFESWLYAEDMPPEVLARATEASPVSPVSPLSPVTPVLHEVREVAEEAEPPTAKRDVDPGQARRHLRVVK